MMYSKLDINGNIKTTDTHARDMHMFFFFSKAVLHNILKLLSLGQLLQQFILNTTTVHTGTPRKSEQSALQRRQLDLGDRFNRSPFLMGEGWGGTEASIKKRINKKKKTKKNQAGLSGGTSSRCGKRSSRKGTSKNMKTTHTPSPSPPKTL